MYARWAKKLKSWVAFLFGQVTPATSTPALATWVELNSQDMSFPDS